MTRKQLEQKLTVLEPETEDQKKELVCALIGHSRIQTTFFGYYYCGRCSAQLGDSLGSIYSGAENAVIVGHNCPQCRENHKKCTWKDKFMAPDPFKEEAVTA